MIYISRCISLEDIMQVSKWGNSLAVRLPKELVEQLGLSPGDEIEVVKATRHELAIEKVDRRERFLKAMEQFHWEAPAGYRFDRDDLPLKISSR
jgi:antitoxin MazE